MYVSEDVDYNPFLVSFELLDHLAHHIIEHVTYIYDIYVTYVSHVTYKYDMCVCDIISGFLLTLLNAGGWGGPPAPD